MPDDFPPFTIVLPCYNPQPGWAENILHAWEQLEGLQPRLILVNDGSQSDISEGIAMLQEKVPDFLYHALPANRGKGAAVRHGLGMATTPWVIYTDVDFPYTPESLLRILDALQREDCDIAVGVKDAAYYAGVPRARRIISKVLRQLTGKLTRLSVADTQCGLKGIKKDALKYFLAGTIDRYLFDLEALYLAERGGARLVEVPVTLRPGIVFSPVKARLLITEVRNFMRILRGKRRY